MNLHAISINHRTAPVELRESLHLSTEEITGLIDLLKKDLFSEGVILSTCNRTEVFGFPKDYRINYKDIQNVLLNFKPVKGIKPEHFEKYFTCSAVKHLFNISAGIDSMITGDSQILGQVKEAFEIADDQNFVGSILRRVSETAVRVGKRSIKETSIGEGAVSVSYAAVQVVGKIFASLDKKSALVIGAGETGELAAYHLRDKGVGNITISNRTMSKAEALAEKVHGEIIPYNDLKEHLHKFDVIISATSAPDYIISKADVKASMKKRKGNPSCLIDIAVPRDIDPSVGKIDNVFYNDIDSLQTIVDQNLKKRKEEIPLVSKIVMEEMVNLFSWYNTLEVVPTIKSFRDFFEEIRTDEMEKLKNKVSDEDIEKVDDMTRRMIGRILHNPTVKLRELAESGSNIQEASTNAMIIKELFGLEKRNGRAQNDSKNSEDDY